MTREVLPGGRITKTEQVHGVSPGLIPNTPKTAHIGIVGGESISNIHHRQHGSSARHHTSTVENYIPIGSGVKTSPQRTVTHVSGGLNHSPLREQVVHQETTPHQHSTTYVPRSTYDRSMVSNTRISPPRQPTTTILNKYSARQSQLI